MLLELFLILGIGFFLVQLGLDGLVAGILNSVAVIFGILILGFLLIEGTLYASNNLSDIISGICVFILIGAVAFGILKLEKHVFNKKD